MCIVSAVHKQGLTYDPKWWDRHKLDQFKKVIESAKEFDKETKQPDCADPEKLKLIQTIEDYLAKSDDALKKRITELEAEVQALKQKTIAQHPDLQPYRVTPFPDSAVDSPLRMDELMPILPVAPTPYLQTFIDLNPIPTWPGPEFKPFRYDFIVGPMSPEYDPLRNDFIVGPTPITPMPCQDSDDTEWPSGHGDAI